MSPQLFLAIIERTFAKQRNARAFLAAVLPLLATMDTPPRRRR